MSVQIKNRSVTTQHSYVAPSYMINIYLAAKKMLQINTHSYSNALTEPY